MVERSDIFDIAVVGGGIAGISAAAELAAHARVVVLEAEAQPGYHATGRSAAILAQTYGSPVIRALTRASGAFFSNPPKEFGTLLSPRGLLRVAREDQLDRLRAEFVSLEDTNYLEWADRDEMQRMVPLLRPGYCAGGYRNADAQDIDVHGLLTGYLRQFRQRGGVLMTGAPVARIARSGQGWRLDTGAGSLAAGQVVNAAGAWADEFARMADVAPLDLAPMRRSAITFDPPAGMQLKTMPMIVDADEELYLKPEVAHLLASPADETVSPPTDARPEELDIAICVDRITKAFDLEVRRIESSWAGLRTFAADRAPVCGYDAHVPGFFWLAAQGGYGVQTAPALSRLAAALMQGRAPDAEIAAAGLTPELVSPGRCALPG